MADELKAPVAIRITRPYATEAEFLEREFDTLTHTSVILLGAQARPQGVVLRFEIVLVSGESMLRGEGRVVAYKEKAYNGEPGLTLRFTRLDSRSKTLVDRASALREARVRGSTSLMSTPAVVVPKPGPGEAAPVPPSVVDSSPRLSSPAPSRSSAPPPPPLSRRAPPPLPEWAQSARPPPLPPAAPSSASAMEIDVDSTQVDPHFERGSLRAPEPAPPAPPVAPPQAPRGIRPTPARPPPMPATISRPPPPPPKAPVHAKGTKSDLERPADRDALLTRLRTRALGLPATSVSEILAKRASR